MKLPPSLSKMYGDWHLDALGPILVPTATQKEGALPQAGLAQPEVKLC